MHALLRSFTLFAALLPIPGLAQPSYDNPVDKQTYAPPGGFKNYQPAVPRNTDGQRIVIERLIMLTAQEDMAKRVSVADLVAFSKAAEQAADVELAKNKKPMLLLVQFNCLPGRCDVRMSSQGEAEQAVLQRVYEAVTRLAPPKVSDEIRFQLQIRVKT